MLTKLLGGAVAVGLMTAWMMPPTRPKPVAPSPLAGLARVRPMELPPVTPPPSATSLAPQQALYASLPLTMVEAAEARPVVTTGPGDGQPAPSAKPANVALT